MSEEEHDEVVKLELFAVHELVVQVRALVEACLHQAPVITRVLEAEARRSEMENEHKQGELQRNERCWVLVQELAASGQVRWATGVGVVSLMLSLSALVTSWAGIDLSEVLGLIPGIGA